MIWSTLARRLAIGCALSLSSCSPGSEAFETDGVVHGAGTGAPSSHAALTDCSEGEAAQAMVEPLAGSAERYVFRSSTSGGEGRIRRYEGCPEAGAGPERAHRLDLSHLSGRFRLYAVVDAEFEPVLALGNGECSDMVELTCSRDPFGRREARFAEELEPGVYILVVDGASEDDHGAYTLRVVAEPLDADCGVPGNTACSSATPLDFQDTTARVFLPKECEGAEEDEFFFALDLPSESSLYAVEARFEVEDYRVGAENESDTPALELLRSNEFGECELDSPVVDDGLDNVDGLSLSMSLPPGRYALKLSRPASRASYLRVEVQQPDCSGEAHDTCADAEEIVLRGDHASIQGSTYCNTDTFSLADCWMYESAPDRFYRLDLRSRSERVRVRAQISPRGLNFYAALALLREEDGDCGALLQCFDPIANGDGWPRVDAIVEPGVYLLVVKGVAPLAAGTFTLDVDVSDWRTKDYLPCYGGDVDYCLSERNRAAGDCCENPLGEACGAMFVSCGLAPSVQDCVCQRDPVCCAGEVSDAERCAPVFEECNYFCPDAAVSVACLKHSQLFSLVELN